MERLFIYGSLQPGGPNEHLLADLADEWEPAIVTGRLVDAGWGASMGYPGLVIDENGGEISGHILRSGRLSEVWAELDEFEGQEYERVQATATLADGRTETVQVYVLRGY